MRGSAGFLVPRGIFSRIPNDMDVRIEPSFGAYWGKDGNTNAFPPTMESHAVDSRYRPPPFLFLFLFIAFLSSLDEVIILSQAKVLWQLEVLFGIGLSRGKSKIFTGQHRVTSQNRFDLQSWLP